VFNAESLEVLGRAESRCAGFDPLDERGLGLAQSGARGERTPQRVRRGLSDLRAVPPVVEMSAGRDVHTAA
jgi:hypothetical protein